MWGGATNVDVNFKSEMANKFAPKVFDFITWSNWAISNLDSRNWIGQWKTKGEVNDFWLVFLYI